MQVADQFPLSGQATAEIHFLFEPLEQPAIDHCPPYGSV